MTFISLFYALKVKNFEVFLFSVLLRNITFAPASVIPIAIEARHTSYTIFYDHSTIH